MELLNIIDWNDDCINWDNVYDTFIRVESITLEDLDAIENSFYESTGFTFPTGLANFWLLMGGGFLCPTRNFDNAVQTPQSALDIYFGQGKWKNFNHILDILPPNELPFFRSKNLDFYTIGLEEGVNRGKIYLFGEKVADSVREFVDMIAKQSSAIAKAV